MKTHTLLEVDAIDVFYGQFQALRQTSLRVAAGETVAIIGANGAGKSTLLRAICGLVPVARGDIRFDGVSNARIPPHELARRGIALVPEGRRIFPSLTVEENLQIRQDSQRPWAAKLRRQGTAPATGPAWSLDQIYELFPALKQRARYLGSKLSGGEQQMLAIGRALIGQPRIVLFDELSLGLAPLAVKSLYETVERIRHEGITIVLVEQDVRQSLRIADRVYCLQEGRINLEGRPAELSYDQIRLAYFGV